MSGDGIVKIHGKAYRTVARRVADFRAKYPPSSGWAIDTKIEQLGDGSAIVRASIISPEGRPVATALAQDAAGDSSRHKTSWLEIAETSAVGRALAFFSLETMGDEFNIASAEEVQNARAASERIEALKEELNEVKKSVKPETVEAARKLAADGSIAFMRRESEIRPGWYDIAEALVTSWREILSGDHWVVRDEYEERLENVAEYFQGELSEFADMNTLLKGEFDHRLGELERLEEIIKKTEGEKR